MPKSNLRYEERNYLFNQCVACSGDTASVQNDVCYRVELEQLEVTTSSNNL